MRRLIVCVVAFWCALGAILPVSAQTSEETDAPIATGDDAPNPIPTKVMLDVMGLGVGQCRLPMGPPPDGLADRARAVLAGLGRG